MSDSKFPRRHIALFMQDLHGGGAERMTINLARGLADRGHKVDLIVTKGEGAYLDLVPQNVRLIDLKTKVPILSVSAMKKYLIAEKPHSVLGVLNQPNVAALVARRLCGSKAKIVISIRNTLTEEAKNAKSLRMKMMPTIVKAVAKWADAVVSVSSGAADDFARLTGIDRERIQVIYNPVVDDSLLAQSKIRPDHPYFVDGHKPVVLAAGRLSHQKDYPTLLRAFAEVRKNYEARLMILGEGPDRDALTQLATELGIVNDLALPGFVSPPFGHMGHCSVFVLSSLFEGLPGVLIQAMACGAPVVATNCRSGPFEILRNGEYGLLSSVGDVAALAANITSALDHPKPPPSESWERFRLETSVDDYEQLLAA